MDKKWLSAFMVGIFALSASAVTCVWKVEKDGKSLYIGGTCHCLAARDYPLPVEFGQAYSNSAAMVFECNLDELNSEVTQKKIKAAWMYTDGSHLKDHLSAFSWAALTDYCATNKIPLESLAEFKPPMAMLALMFMELGKLGVDPNKGVDQYFNRLAAKDGKPVKGLETVDQQISYVASLGKDAPDEFVRYSLKDTGSLGDKFRDIVAAWRAGDEKKLDVLVQEEMEKDFQPLYQTLVLDRNAAWAPQIEAMLATPEREFILVGAGHLVGSGSVLSILRSHGCTVTQLETNK
jgi:uncharacterized protein YbaP (TraB family)